MTPPPPNSPIPPWRATCLGGPWDGRELAFRRLRAVMGPGGQVLCWVPDGEDRFPDLPDGSYAMTQLGTLAWVPKPRRPKESLHR